MDLFVKYVRHLSGLVLEQTTYKRSHLQLRNHFFFHFNKLNNENLNVILCVHISYLNMIRARPIFLIAIALGSVSAVCHQELWSVCDALNEAQTIGIPGGSGSCSTLCQVENDCANFELKCDLEDETSSADESGMFIQ